MPYCSFCGESVPTNSNFCGACGHPREPVANDHATRATDMRVAAAAARTAPTAGIVVAGILGVVDLWWALSSFTPGPLDLALYTLVPALAPFTLISASVNSLGNISLLIGVGLTALSHDRGPQVVRITCVLMLVATILLGIGMFSAVSGSLDGMEPQVRSGFEGGIIGGIVGGLIVWSLILVLFKRSRSW
jgi:hypothetical protein